MQSGNLNLHCGHFSRSRRSIERTDSGNDPSHSYNLRFPHNTLRWLIIEWNNIENEAFLANKIRGVNKK